MKRRHAVKGCAACDEKDDFMAAWKQLAFGTFICRMSTSLNVLPSGSGSSARSVLPGDCVRPRRYASAAA